MRKKRKLSECLSGEVQVVQQATGTRRSLLQDLLSSTVLVKRVKLSNCQTESHPNLQSQDKHLPSTPLPLTQEVGNGACSICGSCNENCQPFTQKEMEILGEFILKPFLISISAAENLATMFHWLCLGCCRTLEKLAKLKKEIDKITTCLRAIIRIQLKKNDASSVIAVPEKLPETEPDLLNDDDNESDNSLQSRPNSIYEDDEEPIKTLSQIQIEENQVISSHSEVDPLAPSPKKPVIQRKAIKNKKRMGNNNKFKRGTERVKCHLCMLDYASEFSLGRHLRSKLHEEGTKSRKINANGTITFACDICQQEFIVLTELVSHKKANHKNAPRSKQLQSEEGEGDSVPENINVHVDISSYFDNNSTDSVEHDDGDMKPVILDMEFDIMDDQAENTEPSPEIGDQVRTKRKSRARAEELLHAMTKNNPEEDDANEDEGSDANVDSEDEESDSSYDGESHKTNMLTTTTRQAEKIGRSHVTSKNNAEDGGNKNPVKLTKTSPLKCFICGEKSLNSKALTRHISQHPRNECDICDVKFSIRHTYKLHLLSGTHKMGIATRRINNDGVITFSCQKCNRSFNTVGSLATHMTKTHSEAAIKKRELCKNMPIKCDPCEKIFQSAEDLRHHLGSKGHAERIGDAEALEKLEKRETFQCDLCDKRYSNLRSFQEHKRDHHEKGPVICHICGKQLMNFAKSLKKHIACMHPDKPKPPVIRKKPNFLIPPQNKHYPCKICGKRFTQKWALPRHVKVVHEGYRDKCDLCQKEFRSNESFRKHKILVHGQSTTGTMEFKNKAAKQRFSCEICSCTLVGKSNLNRHIELKHFPAKDSCPYGCPDKIETEEEWIAHLENCKSEKMTEESKCFCIYCGDVFSNQLLRIAHHLRLHKSYPCEFCPRTFTRNEVLSQHVHEHEESKPWLCTKCGKRFRQPWNLQLHSTTVCGDDEAAKQALIAKRRELHKIYREKAKPHKCNQCGKSFVEERRLEDHKNKIHLNEIETEEDEVPPPTADEQGEKDQEKRP